MGWNLNLVDVLFPVVGIGDAFTNGGVTNPFGFASANSSPGQTGASSSPFTEPLVIIAAAGAVVIIGIGLVYAFKAYKGSKGAVTNVVLEQVKSRV